MDVAAEQVGDVVHFVCRSFCRRSVFDIYCAHGPCHTAQRRGVQDRQIKFDIQGLPSPYVGKTYDEHAALASAIMGHDVAIHEQTYLPVSPSHQTREQELAAAASAEPLGAAVAAAAAVAESCSDDEF